MTSTLNVCYRNGAVVGISGALSDDPHDYIWTPALTTGCNRIQCGRCRTLVTVDRAERGRRYVCACNSYLAQSDQRYLDGQPEDGMDAGPPADWGCAGHAARALPTRLDGVDIAAHPDWDAMLAAADALAPTPPSWLPEYANAWLERLVATVSQAERARFGAAVLRALDNVAALDMAERLRLVPVAREIQRRVAAGGFAFGTSRRASTIVDLLHVAATPDADEAVVKAAFREALLRAPGAGGLVFRLVRDDAAWLAENVPTLARANPLNASRVLTALGDSAPDQLTNALEALLSAGVGAQSDLERAVLRNIPPSDQAPWLARIAGHTA